MRSQYQKTKILNSKKKNCQHYYLGMKNKPGLYQCIYCLDVTTASKLKGEEGGGHLTEEEMEGCQEAKKS